MGMGAGGRKKILPAGFWWQLFASAPRLRRKAEAKARSGRVKEALTLYQKLLARYPEDVDILLAVADLFFRLGKWDKAAQHYWKAVTLDVDRIKAYRGYLGVLQRMGCVEEAVPALQQLRRAHPESPCPVNYLAVALYLNGSITEAARLWEEVLEKYPKFAPAHSNLGSVYLQQGDFARALFCFQLAAELEQEGRAVAYNNIGEVYLLRGDYNQAMGFFQKAIELEPQMAIPYANLGHCYYAVGKWKEAIAVYEEALSALNPGLSSDDTEIEVLTCLTRVYAKLRQYDRAIEVGLRVLGRRPGWERILALLGHIYLQKGEFEKAVEYLQRALMAGGEEWLGFALHRNLALVYYRMGRFKEAVAEYKVAYATYSDYLFMNVRPQPLGEVDEVVKEVDHLRQVLEGSHEGALSHRRMAQIYEQLGAWNEAAAHYQEVLTLEPGDVETLVRLGVLYLYEEDFLQSMACLARAVELDPEYLPAHLGQGLAYLVRGSTDTAILKFRWALTLDPQHPASHNLLGLALMKRGKLQEAMESFRRATELAPDYAQAYYNLGRVLLSLGNPKGAIGFLRKAVEIHSDYQQAWSYLGEAYLRAGQRAEAEEALTTALRIYPVDPMARVRLAILRGSKSEEGYRENG